MLNSELVKFAHSIIATIHELLERDDQIRAAYQWLDAQKKVEKPLQNDCNLGQLIGYWSGLDITDQDVAVAAGLHQTVRGGFPFLLIDSRFTFPSTERLRGIGSSFSFHVEDQPVLDEYHHYETVTYMSGDDQGIILYFDRKLLPEAYFDPNDFCAQHANCECYYCMFGR